MWLMQALLFIHRFELFYWSWSKTHVPTYFSSNLSSCIKGNFCFLFELILLQILGFTGGSFLLIFPRGPFNFGNVFVFYISFILVALFESLDCTELWYWIWLLWLHSFLRLNLLLLNNNLVLWLSSFLCQNYPFLIIFYLKKLYKLQQIN